MSPKKIDRVVRYDALSASVTAAGIMRLYHVRMDASSRHLHTAILDEIILAGASTPSPEQALSEALRLYRQRLEGQWPIPPM